MSDDAEKQLEGIEAELANKVDEAADADALYALQVEFLGKKGKLTRTRALMGKLDVEGKKAFGKAFNAKKSAMEQRLAARKEAIEAAAREAELSRVEDLTALPQRGHVGSMHIITRTRRALEHVFRGLGFDVLDGPHIESEKYNFDDLNIPADHPARDMQDTFFVRKAQGPAADGLVLRTHTSPVQVRAMLTREPPIRIIAPGTVFRRDDDATHSPMFHQIEGLCIDEGVSMADLKATMERFVRAFFGQDLSVRLRPSYFPFVEPGAEFDIVCPFCERTPEGEVCSVCKDSGWIELGGSGMVHPEVLRAGGIDPERYTGWAFGFGIDRMAMLRYGVPHLRIFFEGDLRFLEQYPC